MLVIFAVLIGGICAGRMLSGRRLGFLPHLISVIIWALLFLLGVEVGANPDVAQGMATLGRSAFVVFAFSTAGSIAAAWLLWRQIRSRITMQEQEPVDAGDASLWHALRGSVVIVAFFAAGCVAGLFAVVPFDVAGAGVSAYVLYALMFSVGMTLGHDKTLAGQVRRLDRRLILLPLATIVGTLGGAAIAAAFASLDLTDSLAVGAGFGYYSLSSIFIADLRSVELAAVALLCNVMREIFTLVAAPLVARWFGPLAAVSIGGATTFDTTLPIITRAAGKRYAVVAVFHGCVVDFSVPFLVTLFCTL